MKLVKQKEGKRLDSPSRSPKKRKLKNDNEKFQDVSDVESAPKTQKDMFNCSLHTNTLEAVLDHLKRQIDSNSSKLFALETDLKLKTTDRALGLHLDRVCSAVPKEVGEKSHKFRLDDQTFLKEDFESQEQL